MKKLCVAVFLSAWLLITLGCSSTPSGTVSVSDLIKKESELLGQNVVIVGTAETRTSMASFNMFKVFNRSGDSIWVTFPDTDSMPPQGASIRVSGKLDRKKFTGFPEDQLYIEATAVAIE
jgi:hypothetical protein